MMSSQKLFKLTKYMKFVYISTNQRVNETHDGVVNHIMCEAHNLLVTHNIHETQKLSCEPTRG